MVDHELEADTRLVQLRQQLLKLVLTLKDTVWRVGNLYPHRMVVERAEGVLAIGLNHPDVVFSQ